MSFEFHLPDLAEGMTEAEVVAWKVEVGDTVDLDQPIVEVMSDKATVEIPCPKAGTVAKLNYSPGDICEVGHVLFVIELAGDASAKANVAAPEFGTVDEGEKTKVFEATSNEFSEEASKTRVFKKTVVIDASADRMKVLATPSTRRLARTMGIDITQVLGTGRIGRVTNEDLKSFTSNPDPIGSPPNPSAQAVAIASARQPISITATSQEERIPFRGIRKRIADNMTRSAFTATHFTYVEEVDTSDLVVVRNRAKSRGEERGIKLTYLPFIVKAVVAGLKRHPSLNASLDEVAREIVIKRYYNIGIATQGPSGLTVAVVRNADKLSIFEIASEIQRISLAVQNGTASRDDLSGSTFTISSLGKLGGLMATPIINFPEVGILGVHKMEQRPAVVNNEIAIRWKMNLSISLDHRLVDGYDGAIFVQDVKSLLEDPTAMFMEMV